MLTPPPNISLSRYSKKMVEFSCSCGRKKITSWSNYLRNPNIGCGKCWLNTLQNKIHMLTLVDTIDENWTTNSKPLWRCDCGNIKNIAIKSVLRGLTKSCGCYRTRPMIGNCDNRQLSKINTQSLIGKKFGNLKYVDTRNEIIHAGSDEKFLFECDCGNKKEIMLGSVTRGNTETCGECGWINSSDIIGKKFGHLTVVSVCGEKVGPYSHSKILTKCSCGQTCRKRFDHVFNGKTTSCGKCYQNGISWWDNKCSPAINHNGSYSLEYLSNYFDGSYLKPLSGCKNLNSYTQFQCLLCGKIYQTQVGWLWNAKVVSCGCINGSKLPTRLARHLNEHKIQYEFGIDGYHFDLLIDNTVLCECHGLGFHSDELRNSRAVDRQKRKIALDNNYKYMMVYEDEIDNNPKLFADIILSRVNKKQVITLRPKQCCIKQINNKQNNIFLDKFHYLGGTNNYLSIGVFYDGDLIASLSFKKPTRQSHYDWELSRMCSHPEYRVHGIWSCLMKYVLQHTNISGKIVSFSDNRLFSGNIYKILGFIDDGQVKQDYYWVKDNKRFHKSSLRKPKGYHGTETELRTSEGYFKIYDLGKTRWVLDAQK